MRPEKIGQISSAPTMTVIRQLVGHGFTPCRLKISDEALFSPKAFKDVKGKVQNLNRTKCGK